MLTRADGPIRRKDILTLGNTFSYDQNGDHVWKLTSTVKDSIPARVRNSTTFEGGSTVCLQAEDVFLSLLCGEHLPPCGILEIDRKVVI
jgi:hypothetical protein